MLSNGDSNMRGAVQTRYRRVTRLLYLGVLVACTCLAQQGHPLVGSWSGEWTPPDGNAQRVLLVLAYDTHDTISGQVYFGTRRVPLSRATLDPSSWTVHLEAEATDTNGRGVDYVIDGRIENLGSTTERSIIGNLSANGERGPFRVVMN